MHDMDMKKDVLKEIMGLMSQMGYEKMKKPMSMKVEMVSDESPDAASVVNPPDVEKPFGEGDEAAKGADESESLKERLMRRFGK